VALASEEAMKAPCRLHLSEQPMKQVVTGPALVPDAPIFRLSGDNKPYYIKFSAPVIESIAGRFLGSANLKNTTDEHAIALQGNQVVESWVVTDPTNDKSAALGLNVPAGTWMLSVHIPDTAYWQNEILSGNRTGFSIEAMLDLAEPALFTAEPDNQPALDEVKPNTVNQPKRKKSLLARLMRAVFLSIEKIVDGPELEIDDNTQEVFTIDADGNRVAPLADGTYTLESGETLSVLEGKKSDIPADPNVNGSAEAPAATTEVEQATETPAQAEPQANTEFDTLRAELEQLRQLIDQMQQANQTLTATNTELQTKLSAAPAAKPVKLTATPETEAKAKRTYERYAEAALRGL
jgi:hypothetical protein